MEGMFAYSAVCMCNLVSLPYTYAVGVALQIYMHHFQLQVYRSLSAKFSVSSLNSDGVKRVHTDGNTPTYPTYTL